MYSESKEGERGDSDQVRRGWATNERTEYWVVSFRMRVWGGLLYQTMV